MIIVGFLVYYSISNIVMFKDEYFHYLQTIGAVLILISGILFIGVFSVLRFKPYPIETIYVKIHFFILATGIVLLSIHETYSIITFKKNNQNASWPKTFASLPFGVYRILGILFLLGSLIWRFSSEDPFIIKGESIPIYLLILFSGLILLTVGERKLNLALTHQVSEPIGIRQESAIIRDDILLLRAYGEITNRFIRKVKPVVGEGVVSKILDDEAENNPILFDDYKIKSDTTLDINYISDNISNITEEHRMDSILSSFGNINTNLIETYSSLTSLQLARKNFETIYFESKNRYGNPPIFLDILRSLPEKVLEEEKLRIASKDELEEKVKERTKELAKALKRAERERKEKGAIIEAMVDPLLVLDADGNISSINAAYERVFGFDKEKMRGKNIRDQEWISQFDEETKNKFLSYIERAFHQENTTPKEISLPTKDGDNIPITLTAGVMIRDKDEEKNQVLVFRDISGRKKAEEWKDFLHSLLRHDVGNKIQIVQGYLELLKDTELDDDKMDMIERALKSIKSCSHLISRVRILKEVESQKLEGEINLSFILNEAINLHEKQAKDNDFKIIYDKNGTDVNVKSGSRGGALLESVFSNLIDNAIKHSEGSKIKISAKNHDDSVVVSVEDDGNGIPSQLQEEIRENGFMKEDVIGEGLGLRIVRNVIQNLGGDVKIEKSELGGIKVDIEMEKV